MSAQARAPAVVAVEGEAAGSWVALLRRLIKLARPGALYPEAARLHQLLELCARVAPRKTRAEVRVNRRSGLPAAGLLERLTAMREVAGAYLRDHGAEPSRAAQGWSNALAAALLPPIQSTQARLVSKGKGMRRFLVVHDRWEGPHGCPARYTVHLSDPAGRYLGLDPADQAEVKPPLRLALEVACGQGAEAAFLQLGGLEGVELSEVVLGQLGPFEAPGWVSGPGPLGEFLKPHPQSGVLHLVLERAASSLAVDASLDPFGPLDLSPEALKRRKALGFHLSRERRLCCPPELQPPLQAQLRRLGASLIVRSS